MAKFSTLLKVIVFLAVQKCTVFGKKSKAETGIFLQVTIEATMLQNVDLAAILDDIKQTGCWIYLAGNHIDDSKVEGEIQLPAQIQIATNPQNFYIPLLLRDLQKVSVNKYQNFLTDGLSLISQVKNSFCFINIFHFPFALQLARKQNAFSKEIKNIKARIRRHSENPVFCRSSILGQNCSENSTLDRIVAAKFTLFFLEITEQGNVIAAQESQNKVNTNSKKQNNDKNKNKNTKKNKQNFPEPFFSTFNVTKTSKIIPLIIIMIKIPVQIKGRQKSSKRKIKISSLWFLNHLTILDKKEAREFPCFHLKNSTKLKIEFSCYFKIMSKCGKNKNFPFETSMALKFPFQIQTPADRIEAVKLTTTLSSFLKFVLANETWKLDIFGNEKYWYYKKLQVQVMQTAIKSKRKIPPLIWILTSSRRFKFITSDSVYSTKTTVQIYTTPFQKEVWTLLFVSMATTLSVLFILALALALFRYQKETKTSSKMALIWKILSELCLWILRILLEQPDQQIPSEIQSQIQNQIHQNFIKNLLKRAIRLILGVWLMMSLILVNGYRGIIKSSYTLDFPFTSQPKWNSSLDFFKDGTFFVYYTQMDFGCPGEFDIETRFFNLTIFWDDEFFHKQPAYFESRDSYNLRIKAQQSCQSLCPKESIKLSFEKSGCQKFEACQEFYKLRRIFVRQNKTCTTEIPNLIQNKLRFPKTVFMTTAQDFPIYWNQFKRQMKKYPELEMKFIHNGQKEDRKVQENYGFAIELGLLENDPDFILKPLEILITSGILWWWEKWENMKFNSNRKISKNSTESGFIDETLPEFKPLSFQDMQQIFTIWFLFLILPLILFVIEISFNLALKILASLMVFCKEKFAILVMKPRVVRRLGVRIGNLKLFYYR